MLAGPMGAAGIIATISMDSMEGIAGVIHIENVIDPFASTRFLKTYNVFGLFDNADQALVPPWVRADLTNGLFREVVADFTAFNLVLNIPDRLGKPHGLIGPGL